MLFFTHAIGTYSLASVLELKGNELILAYAFGVLPDLDHGIKFIYFFFKKKMWFKIAKIDKKNHWRTALQEPVSLLWVVPLSIYLNTATPVIFFSLHIFMDYLTGSGKRPFFPFSKLTTPKDSNLFSNILREGVFVVVCLVLLLK